MTHPFHTCPSDKSPAIEAKYLGIRTGFRPSVMVQSGAGREPLNPRSDLLQHHPVGFDWAGTGSGPAQLALALLAHASGNDDYALKHYQVFKHEIVARLPKNGWELTSQQVLQMVRFVSQGQETRPTELQVRPTNRAKTAVIHARLPNEAHTFTAHGLGHSTGGAITRAIRNLLRDVRLRRRAIFNLEIELSVVNTVPRNEGSNHGVGNAQS